MDFTLTDDQQAIAKLAEDIFAARATTERVTAAEASAEGDTDLWRALAESGLLGIAIPEKLGGGGLGLLEMCLVLEQQGRRVAPVPLLPTMVSALALAEFGTPEQQEHWLPRIGAGSAVVTAALERGDLPIATHVAAGWRLDGARTCVPAGPVAAAILVPAKVGDEVRLFLVDTVAEGVDIEPTRTTNRELHGHLHLAAAIAEEVGDASAVEWLYQRMTVGLCALQVGIAEEAVRITAAYTAQRKQFGRPLATFQGVLLRAADAYIDTEAMRVTMWQAAWRLTEGLDAQREVVVAKWWASEGGHRVVHAAQHLHGGMGADITYPIHRYFLWGKQIELMLGGASEQLARLGGRIAEDVTAAAR